MSVVGLQIPGLWAADRDRAIKQRAGLLLEGFRALLRESHDLGVSAAMKVRPGFETLAEHVRATYRQFFDWYQALLQQPDGQLGDEWAAQLLEQRRAYDALRGQVQGVLQSQGSSTRSPPGEHVYAPPAEGESWSAWLKRFPSSSGFGFGAVIAIGLFWWFARRVG